jgi:tRNA G46 methylase TrmB
MAQTFPDSQFVGIDYHDASIETAREHAAEAGLTNASF